MSDAIEKARKEVNDYVERLTDTNYAHPSVIMDIATTVAVHGRVPGNEHAKGYNEAIEDIMTRAVLPAVAQEIQQPSQAWFLQIYGEEARETQMELGVLATWQLLTTEPMVGVDLRTNGLFEVVLWGEYEDADRPKIPWQKTLRKAQLIAEQEADRIEKIDANAKPF